jgi:transcriptional regulator with XRE-family HTH domain
MNVRVGFTIRKLRNEKGMTQEQVADYLHVSQSAYARMESGYNNSWSNHLVVLSELFDIQPEQLISVDTIIINKDQKGGNSNNAYVINQLSEKLIEQFELRLKEKDNLIAIFMNKVKGGTFD